MRRFGGARGSRNGHDRPAARGRSPAAAGHAAGKRRTARRSGLSGVCLKRAAGRTRHTRPARRATSQSTDRAAAIRRVKSSRTQACRPAAFRHVAADATDAAVIAFFACRLSASSLCVPPSSYWRLTLALRSSLFALRSSLFALRSSLFALRSSLFALRSSLFALRRQ
ncbi:hypothetical protein FG484_30130 [Burkholderia pseudomallei]|nr:hypothetical protein [Burkholderia pseudomallei]